jgi:hypothetical protein
MADTRHKNTNWALSTGTRNANGVDSVPNDSVQFALLMDIRDELQTLNRLLGCPNFVAVPSILRGIRAKIPTRRRRARKA